MAIINYPNFNTGKGLARPDVAPARFIEFDVDFSKIPTAASGDDIVLGAVPKGSAVLGVAINIVTPAGAAATATPKVGATTVGAVAALAAAANTVTGTTAAAVPVVTTDAASNFVITLGGANAPTGIIKVVYLVSEMIKFGDAALVKRDQSLV